MLLMNFAHGSRLAAPVERLGTTPTQTNGWAKLIFGAATMNNDANEPVACWIVEVLIGLALMDGSWLAE